MDENLKPKCSRIIKYHMKVTTTIFTLYIKMEFGQVGLLYKKEVKSYNWQLSYHTIKVSDFCTVE